MKTTHFPTVEKNWILIDAKGQILGRLATKIANILSGKHKSSYAAGVDNGDHVVVINASELEVTGSKMKNKKYYHHTGYPGGIRVKRFDNIYQSNPQWILRNAVKGMLPKNTLGRKKLGYLKIYADSSHPHNAQKPLPLIAASIS